MNNKWSINYTWSQPYSLNPAYNAQRLLNEHALAHEMQKLEDIDRAVEAMDTYPDAEKLIAEILHQK